MSGAPRLPRPAAAPRLRAALAASWFAREVQFACGAAAVAAMCGFASLHPELRAAPPPGAMCDWDAGAFRQILDWIHPHGWTVGIAGTLALLLCEVGLILHRRARQVASRADDDTRSDDAPGGHSHAGPS